MFHVSTTAVAIDHAFNRPSINQVIKLPKPPISSSCDSEIDQQQSSSVNLFIIIIIIIIIITLTISHSPSAFTIIRNQPCAVLTSYSNNRQHHETESDVMPRVLEPLCPTAAHKLVFVVVVVVEDELVGGSGAQWLTSSSSSSSSSLSLSSTSAPCSDPIIQHHNRITLAIGGEYRYRRQLS